MFCKHCGAKIDDDSTFCPSCGKAQGGARFGNNNVSNRNYTEKPNTGSGLTPGVKTILFILLALVCAAPIFYAEYRRLIEGMFDIWYWIIASPVVITMFSIYQVIGAPAVAREKENIARAKAMGEDYDEEKISTIRTNMISICCVIVAAIAFAASFIIQAIF